MRRKPSPKSRRPRPKPEPSSVALGIRNWRVPLYSHVSYLWASLAELPEVAGFLVAGLRANDHALLVGSSGARQEIAGLLAERGFDVRKLQAAGRITQLGGAPSAEALLDAFEAAFEKAAAAGAPLIRLLGVPGWGEQDWPDDASLLSLEARFSSLAQRYPSVTVCLYDARSLPKRILERGGWGAHPFVIAGGKLIDEAHPVAKDAFLASVTHAASSGAKRKRAEEALAESEARFAKVFHASPVALGMSTITEGRIIDVNESWLELFGYRRDEVIGRTNRELGLSVDPEARQATIRRVRDEGIVRNLEMQARRKSGEVLDLTVSAVPVDLGGEDESWVSAHVDITDRKRAEAERDRLLENATAAREQAEAALDRLRAIQSITDRR